MKVFERKPFYSNEMMFKDCEILLNIINEQEEIKTGRGKNIVITHRYKRKTEPKIRKLIEYSYEHYKKLYELDMKRNNQVKFRDYQKDIIIKGTTILKEHGFLYLAMEVRTGKTLTSLGIAEKLDVKNVLFITKKKAISSIEGDYNLLDPLYNLTVINYESLHTVANNEKWDMIILDEAHSCFVGDTLVDGKKIKDIALGDYIKSFNFVENKYELKKVINIYKNNLTENLIKIRCNGKEIICTESHKIFTKRGWVEARHITSEDELQIL